MSRGTPVELSTLALCTPFLTKSYVGGAVCPQTKAPNSSPMHNSTAFRICPSGADLPARTKTPCRTSSLEVYHLLAGTGAFGARTDSSESGRQSRTEIGRASCRERV